MKYLLDTHVVLWWLSDPHQISRKAHKIIADNKNQVFVSSVSIWEMAIKKEIGKLTIPMNILAALTNENFEILPLIAEECLAIVDLPKIHNDPFDRILVAQAKLNNLVFISKDEKIAGYPIDIIKA